MKRHLFIWIAALGLFSANEIVAQRDDLGIAAKHLGGEFTNIVEIRISGYGDTMAFLEVTDKAVYYYRFVKPSTVPNITYYWTGPDNRVISARFKSDDKTRVVCVLANGTVVVLKVDPFPFGEELTPEKIFPDSSGIRTNATKIVGDALYLLRQNRVYASRDTGATWTLDTIGIYGQSVSDITVDTGHHAWAVTQNSRLYFQHKDSSLYAWRQIPSFVTIGIPFAVFVDRRGRIFVSTNASSRVQASSDGGATWTDVGTGITENVVSFGDDAFGNVYAVGQTSRAYRLTNLTPPWVVISDSITAQAYMPGTAKIVNSIHGDTLIFAATRYGLFQSADSGRIWSHSQNELQARAHNFYAPVVRAGGHWLLSNSLGIQRAAVGDTNWSKVFPTQGFVWGINALASDSAGNAYGNFPIKTTPTTTVYYPVKSTDGGLTWNLDTAGFSALGINAQNFDYYVDAQGAQYLGGASLYVKKPGQSWKRDTTGSGGPVTVIRQVSRNNKKGVVYMSLSRGGLYQIYSRAAGDTVWSRVNSDTLGATVTDGILQSDHNGDILVKVFATATIWRYDGGRWTTIPLPTGLPFSPNPLWITVDRSGVIWSAFLGSGRPRGVYFTSDNGATWRYAGLDSAAVRFMSTDEDTVYVVTTLDGIFKFTTTSVSRIANVRPRPSAFRLYQNHPNPFRGVTRLRFDLPQAAEVRLVVYDMFGREMAVVAKGSFAAGTHRAAWDASGRPGGVYFYRLQFRSAGSAWKLAGTRKLLLLK